MERSENIIEIFEKYSDRTLKADEALDFEKKLSSDKNLLKEFNEFIASKEAVSVLGNLRFRQMLSKIMSEEDNAVKPAKPGNIKNLVSEIFDLFFFPFENIVTTRSGGDKNKVLLNAMTYYSEGNYEKASGIFRELMKKEPDNLLIYFYCGICELALNKAVSSRKFLNKVVKEDKEILNELAGWYLGLSYLKTGNVKSARKIFQSLTSTGKSRDSQNILKKIENL